MITCKDFTNPVDLGKPGECMEFIPIMGKKDAALAEFERKYPWMGGVTVWYHAKTATLFIPASWEAK